MKFGDYLKKAREAENPSFRQLEDKTGIDHAYIWRLEQGNNTNPSPEIVTKLAKALSLSKRGNEIFTLLAETEIPDPLFEIMIENLDIDWEILESAATLSNRGKRPETKEDWMKLIEMIKLF